MSSLTNISNLLALRAIFKKYSKHRMISQEVFTWFDSWIVKQSKLIYAMPWILYNGCRDK